MVSEGMKEYFGLASNFLLDGSTYTEASPLRLFGFQSRVIHCRANDSTMAFVALPDAREVATGGFRFFITHLDTASSGDVMFMDYDGTRLFKITPSASAPMDTAFVCLADNSTSAGTWVHYRMNGTSITKATQTA